MLSATVGETALPGSLQLFADVRQEHLELVPSREYALRETIKLADAYFDDVSKWFGKTADLVREESLTQGSAP